MTKLTYFTRGASVYDYFFLSHLKRDFELTFASFNGEPRHVPKGVKTVSIRDFGRPLPARDGVRSFSMSLPRALALRRFLDQEKPDLLLSGYSIDYDLCSAFSAFKPFGVLIWGSEALLAPSSLAWRSTIKFILQRADMAIVDSLAVYNACRGLGMPSRKLVRLPWFDSVEFVASLAAARLEKEEYRHQRGWGSTDPVVICTRMHEPVYDIPAILHSIPDMLANVPNARFEFVGGGSLTRTLIETVRSLGVERNVHFEGIVPLQNMPWHLKNSDVYVSSSLSDGTSASLLQAMCACLPCVVSDIPANREWIRNEQEGMLFASSNSLALAGCLLKVIADNSLCRRLGENASARVLERACWDSSSKTLYDFLEKPLAHST